MENFFLLVALSPLFVIGVFAWLRYAREGKWLVALARDWREVLRRKSPPDDQRE